MRIERVTSVTFEPGDRLAEAYAVVAVEPIGEFRVCLLRSRRDNALFVGTLRARAPRGWHMTYRLRPHIWGRIERAVIQAYDHQRAAA